MLVKPLLFLALFFIPSMMAYGRTPEKTGPQSESPWSIELNQTVPDITLDGALTPLEVLLHWSYVEHATAYVGLSWSEDKITVTDQGPQKSFLGIMGTRVYLNNEGIIRYGGDLRFLFGDYVYFLGDSPYFPYAVYSQSLFVSPRIFLELRLGWIGARVNFGKTLALFQGGPCRDYTKAYYENSACDDGTALTESNLQLLIMYP